MPISFDEKTKCFRLSSGNIVYASMLHGGCFCHLYYGVAPGNEDDLSYLLSGTRNHPDPSPDYRDKATSRDCLPMEYPCFNTGDFREHALEICDANGAHACELEYISHKIYDGKPSLEGLPASLASESEAQTLDVLCADKACGLEVRLLYTVFEELEVITRSVIVKNASDKPVKLERVYSAVLELGRSDLDMITLNGSWARERYVSRHSLHSGKQSVDSVRGESSHQHNPFFVLCSHNADENMGEAYGFALMYSGNFTALTEVDQHSRARALIGINSTFFSWTLESGESFTAPEAVLVYSESGIGGMSRTYHDFFRRYVIRSQYKYTQRPVLINNWEATYFDFDKDKLLSIAESASELGIEMLVMDDGWFGHRDSDNSSLGDWFVYEKKLGGDLKPLSDGIKKLGMKLGIWFEPEMVSPDSELFRAHPDWALRIPGRKMTMSREQYVLDFSRKDVRDCIFSMMCNIIRGADISYLKWDMNRPLTEVWSALLPPDRQGEASHRYVLGVYELLERITAEFPDLLIEGCSGGGGRFDGGMLCYTPQIWTSDDTDAAERLKIQYGTSLVYPPSAMGAHVSDCPNHITGRAVPFETRGFTALAGTFGYELDVTKISDEEKAMIPQQIENYKKYSHLILSGDYYRLTDAFSDCGRTAWMFVSKDKREALVTIIQTRAVPNMPSAPIKLFGLAEDKLYRINDEYELSGKTLRHCGLPWEPIYGDYSGKMISIQEIK